MEGLDEDVGELLVQLRRAHPHVNREIERQLPPEQAEGNLKRVHPPPLALLTIAVAGAAMARPGIHHIHLYSRHLDLRADLYRMLLDLVRTQEGLDVYLFTRRTRPLRAALRTFFRDPSENDLLGTDVHVLTSTQQLLDLEPSKEGPVIIDVDLDYLSKSTSFWALRRLQEGREDVSILMLGHRQHPLLYQYERAQDKEGWIEWGVNRDQVVDVDWPAVEEATDAIRDMAFGGLDGPLPDRFREVNPRKVIPPQLRSASGRHAARFWSTIAATYACREAIQRLQIDRDIIAVDEPFPEALEEVQDPVRNLLRSVRKSQDVPFSFAQAVEDLAYYRTLPTRICVPIPFVIEELGAWAYSRGKKPVDRLQGILELTKQRGLAPDHLQAEASRIASKLLDYYLSIPVDPRPREIEPGARIQRLIEKMNEALATGAKVAVLVMNEAEARAAKRYLEPRVEHPPEGSDLSRARMTKNLDFIEGRRFHPEVNFDTALLARIPSYDDLDRIIDADTKRVTLIVRPEDYPRAWRTLHYDVLRERSRFGPEAQLCALQAALGKRNGLETMPSALRRKPRPPKLPRSLESTPEETPQDSPLEPEDEDNLIEELLDLHVERSPRGEGSGKDRSLVPNVQLEEDNRIVEYDDGSTEVVRKDDVLQRVAPGGGSLQPVEADNLRNGDTILTTDESVGSTNLSEIVVGLLATHDPTLVGTDRIDKAWREKILDYRQENELTWDELLEEAQQNGYSNESAQSIYFYTQRAVWLPDCKSDFEAVLKTVSPNHFGKKQRIDEIWDRVSRLRKMATSVLRHARSAALQDIEALLDRDPEEDPVLLEDLGLRESHLDGYFQLRTIVNVRTPTETDE